MENSKVTIIIPVYNVAEYLSTCLDSVINQTYQNIEIICVDDGSTDGSWDVLCQYKKEDSRFRLYQNTKSQGVAYARNYGLKVAQGEFIVFVDSDDYIDPELVSMCMKKIDNNDMVCFDYTQFYEENIEEKSHTYLMEDGQYDGAQYFAKAVVNNSIVIAVWSRLYRHKFLLDNQIYFYDGLLYEDVPYTFECLLKASKIYNLCKPLYWYRRRNGSLMLKEITNRDVESYFFSICKMTQFYLSGEYIKDVGNAIELYIRNISRCFIQKYRKIDNRCINRIMGENDEKYTKLYRIFAELCVKPGYIEEISPEQLACIKKFPHVIVYGAGEIGRSVIEILDLYDIPIDGIAVTSTKRNKRSLMGNIIRQIEEYKNIDKDKALVIIAVTEKYYNDIRTMLDDCGFKHYLKLQKW